MSGEGNGNPLQCSCLENPVDRGAWWAVVYGVAQSWQQQQASLETSLQFMPTLSSALSLLPVYILSLGTSLSPKLRVILCDSLVLLLCPELHP